MSEDFKNKVAQIIKNDVIKYLELEIKSSNKAYLKKILGRFKNEEINEQELLLELNEIKEYDLSKRLFNMINVHQKNYHHIFSVLGIII